MEPHRHVWSSPITVQVNADNMAYITQVCDCGALRQFRGERWLVEDYPTVPLALARMQDEENLKAALVNAAKRQKGKAH